jgi:hypothetical protein
MTTQLLLLEAILGAGGEYCLFALEEKDGPTTQKFFKTIPELIKAAQSFEAKGYHVYFGLANYKDSSSRTASNTTQLKSFFLDVDCHGGARDYETPTEALKAIRAFCHKLGLPKPLLIHSGRGVHVYWTLDKPIPTAEWKPIATKLKQQCRAHGLRYDPVVPDDAARVLRMPGTTNRTANPPVEAKCLGDIPKPISVIEFARLIGANVIPLPKVNIPGSNAVMDALMGNKENKFIDILTRTKEGMGCAQLKHIIMDQVAIDEPLWRAGLSIAKFCSDGEKAARIMSSRHPDYDPQKMKNKFDAIKGPYTCAKFDEFYPDVCEKCPHWGKIKSPIVLGGYVKEADPDDALFSSDSDIPKYPAPYFRGANGGVYIRIRGADGEPEEKCIYHNDLYVVKRVRDPEFGESVVMCLHLPRDGVQEFTVPLRVVTSKDEFRKELSSQGVAVPRVDDLMKYTTTWINQLQTDSKAENAHKQFGWTDEDMDVFILGAQKILATEVQKNAPSAQTIHLLPAFEPKGTLAGWRQAIDFWNRDGCELYQYVVGAGFGSILMQLANVNCSALHLHNKESGVAKTTAMIAAAGIWGDWEQLVLHKKDSEYSNANRAEVYRNLPWCIDEITNMSPEDTSNMIYAFTDGQQRNRMSSGSNVERYRGKPWHLMAITTGNTSIIERVSIAKAMPKAEAQRVVECYVPNISSMFDGKKETDDFETLIKNNYGHAGPIFITYVINNLDKVRNLWEEVQSRVDTQGKLLQENRFWSAQITADIVGLLVARHAGLIKYDVSKVFTWVLDVLLPQNKRSSMNLESSAFEVMSNFLNEHIDNILRIKSTFDGRSKNNMDTLVIPEQIARGRLVVRYETDTHKYYIVPKELKNWCGGQQINYAHLLEQLRMTCRCKQIKMRLYKGTNLKLPAAYALRLEFPPDTIIERVEGDGSSSTDTGDD